MPYIGHQSTANSKIKKYSFTADASQDAFTVASNAGDELQVFLNGVLLKETDDYTYTTSTVTLGTGATVSDIVEVHVYQSFSIADTVDITGDTMTGELEVPTVKLSSNVIKASDGGSTITLDDSDNVAITGDLTVTGGDIKSSGGTTAISISSANTTLAGTANNIGTVTAGTLGSSVVVSGSAGGTLCYIDKAVSSGSTTIIEFDNLDNSYAYYKFVIYNVIPDTDNRDFYVQLGTSSAYLTSYLNGATQHTNDSSVYNNASGYLAWAYSVGAGGSADGGLNGEFNIWNCSNTAIPTLANWKFVHMNQNGKIYGNDGSASTNTTTTAVTKVKFFFASSADFASGSTIVRYGVKHG